MAKRIFEIAKELGIESKAIVAKCQAEGIPESVVKNHMSAISAGLEASIRDWFSGAQVEQGGTATAVETSAKVDVASVRTKTTRRKTKHDGAVTAEPGAPGADQLATGVPVDRAPVAPPTTRVTPSVRPVPAEVRLPAPAPTAAPETEPGTEAGAEPKVEAKAEPKWTTPGRCRLSRRCAPPSLARWSSPPSRPPAHRPPSWSPQLPRPSRPRRPGPSGSSSRPR